MCRLKRENDKRANAEVKPPVSQALSNVSVDKMVKIFYLTVFPDLYTIMDPIHSQEASHSGTDMNPTCLLAARVLDHVSPSQILALMSTSHSAPRPNSFWEEEKMVLMLHPPPTAQPHFWVT